MEDLVKTMPSALNLGAQDHGEEIPVPTTPANDDDLGELTALQLAYHKQKSSLFFGRLPSEIRNMVYRHLCIAREDIDAEYEFQKKDFTYRYAFPQWEVDASFARSCRAGLYETYPILYGENNFVFYKAFQVNSFGMKGLGMWRNLHGGRNKMPSPITEKANHASQCDVFGTTLISGARGRLSLIRHATIAIDIGAGIPRKFWPHPHVRINATDEMWDFWWMVLHGVHCQASSISASIFQERALGAKSWWR